MDKIFNKIKGLYLEEKMSARKIANVLGYKTHKSVLDKLKRHNIPRRIGGFQKKHPVFVGCQKTWFRKGEHRSFQTEFKRGHKNWLGRKHSEETKKKISINRKGKNPWLRSEYREKTIKAQLQGLFKTRPTSLERRFIEIIQKHNLPYKYVGDGSVLIGYKNPDFVNVNGEKICIEVANKVSKHHPPDYEMKRIEHFNRYGWKCLVLFADRKNIFDKSEEEIIRRLNDIQ